jgi:hypothetical protein
MGISMMIALRSFGAITLFFTCCFTLSNETNANLVSPLSDNDYQTGYGIAFSFADSSIPVETCATELERIRQALYPSYATELTVETQWTPFDVISTDPELSEYFDLDDRRRLGRTSAAEENRNRQRKLLNCAIHTCTYVRSRPSLKFLLGCLNTCRVRRRELTDGDDDEIQDSSEDDNESSDVEDDTLEYGSRSSYITGYGDMTAESFYAYAEATTVSPCKEMILQMRYVLIPLTMEY